MQVTAATLSALMGADAGSPFHGVIIGPLRESHPDRIVLADRIFWLRDGMACLYPLGTLVEVLYTERAGRCTVDRIRVKLSADGPDASAGRHR
jgi:hypothetical protein